jgi:hypothetical protein
MDPVNSAGAGAGQGGGGNPPAGNPPANNAVVNNPAAGAGLAERPLAELFGEAERGDTAVQALIAKTPNLGTLAKNYMSLERMLGGKLEGYVQVPGEGAAPETVAAWRRAVGIPEQPAGYAVPQMPAGVEVDAARVAEFQQTAHGLGLSSQQFQALMLWDAQATAARQAAYAQQIKAVYPDDAALQAAVAKGQAVLARVALKRPELRDQAQNYIGHDLLFTQLLAEIAGQFGEDQAPGSAQKSGTSADAQARIEFLKAETRKPDLPDRTRQQYLTELAGLLYKT